MLFKKNLTQPLPSTQNKKLKFFALSNSTICLDKLVLKARGGSPKVRDVRNLLKIQQYFWTISLFLFCKNIPKTANVLKHLNISSLFTYPAIFNFVSYLTSLTTNSALMGWYTQNKQLFRVNFLSLTIKFAKRNIFFSVVNPHGEVLWKASSGLVGFKSKYKKTPDAMRMLVSKLSSFLKGCNVLGSYVFRFGTVKGFDKQKIAAIFSLLEKTNIFIAYLSYNIAHPHGYMRLRKPRRL